MSQSRQAKYESLAIAMATGHMSVRAWSKANGVSESTGLRWSKLPGVQARSLAIRDDFANKVVARLVRHAGSATAQLNRIIHAPGTTDSNRIAAIRTMLTAHIGIRSTVAIEEHLAEIEIKRKADEKGSKPK